MDPSDFEPATPQELVDAAGERKGIEYIRENFHAYFAPARIMVTILTARTLRSANRPMSDAVKDGVRA